MYFWEQKCHLFTRIRSSIFDKEKNCNMSDSDNNNQLNTRSFMDYFMNLFKTTKNTDAVSIANNTNRRNCDSCNNNDSSTNGVM